MNELECKETTVPDQEPLSSNELPYKGAVDIDLDTQGLQCPMPLLKAKQSLNRMSPGQVLRVVATDQGSVRDFQVFAAQSGNTLLGQHEEALIYTHWLEKC
jgi:tRNA 2-thiouridine synthesizing protein A